MEFRHTFRRDASPELNTLQGDVGARDLLRQAAFVCLRGGDLDIDTVEDLERARMAFDSDHAGV